MHLGLDFGTTNSALARLDDDGVMQLARFVLPPSRSAPKPVAMDTFRSVLWFDPDEKGPDRRPLCMSGLLAIQSYIDAAGAGRFIQSVKSHLASKTFTSTMIFNAKYTLEDLVGLVVRGVRTEAEKNWGAIGGRVVAGRPVHFVRDDLEEGAAVVDAADVVAEERLRAALASAGFHDVVFELEPVAAAARWEQRSQKDELVLIADFGGGTTDLCLVEVGPAARKKAAIEGGRQVIGTGGLGVAGDTLDRRIIHNAIAPRLGWGTQYRVFGGAADVPLWIFNSLSRWHALSFLKSRKTMTLLDEIVATADDPAAVRSLRQLIDDDLSYLLHRAVEKAKIDLSKHEQTVLKFPEIDVELPITRAQFEGWIKDDVARIDDAVDAVLERAGRPKVKRVFMTGGTALVPAVRKAFAKRFGRGALEGGEELVSVAQGLALRARDVFGARPSLSKTS
ncbi:MAG: Hsp70 family protein [Deltaproteobacteria bacterium]|nr:Hsp70 family protein [Deltaproteobacteria bacterium]